MKIPMAKPDLTNLEIEYATKAITEGEIGVKSPYVQKFEEKLAAYLGFKYAVFCNSGWSALLLAVRASGFKEFIVPTFTMIASATAIKQGGALAIFEDVDDRGLMNGTFFKPTMAVDIYGKMANVKAPFVIEDAAEIFGKFPYYGDIVCFSFFYNKIITVGQGGVCLTNNSYFYEQMKLLRHHYYDGKNYVHLRDGYNLSQSGIHAAIGLAQLERAEEIIEKRQILGRKYVKELDTWECDVYWYQPYLCKSQEEKEKLKNYLEEKGIATRDFFYPIHLMPPFEENPKRFRGTTKAEELSERGLLLPLYSAMTEEEQNYIIHTIRSFESMV